MHLIIPSKYILIDHPNSNCSKENIRSTLVFKSCFEATSQCIQLLLGPNYVQQLHVIKAVPHYSFSALVQEIPEELPTALA